MLNRKSVFQTDQQCSDPTLPKYYDMMNSIIIAHALDDWEDADVYRLAVEFVYDCELKEAQRKHNAVALECLEEIREELDDLNHARLEDLGFTVEPPGGFDTDPTEAYLDLMMTERDEEVENGADTGERKVVSGGKKEGEVGDRSIGLPVRAAPAIKDATPETARAGDE